MPGCWTTRETGDVFRELLEECEELEEGVAEVPAPDLLARQLRELVRGFVRDYRLLVPARAAPRGGVVRGRPADVGQGGVAPGGFTPPRRKRARTLTAG